MKKDQLSFSDVERLLSEMAQHDNELAAREAQQTELMRGAVSGEIRRVFLRRRCLRMAGSSAVLFLLGAGAALFLPEQAAETRALAASVSQQATPSPREKTSTPRINYSTTIGAKENVCEVVIYAVPL